MDEIIELWKVLVAATEKKGEKLQEASQQQQFNRTVEDIELWLSEIEGQLLSEDYGKVQIFLFLCIPILPCRWTYCFFADVGPHERSKPTEKARFTGSWRWFSSGSYRKCTCSCRSICGSWSFWLWEHQSQTSMSYFLVSVIRVSDLYLLTHTIFRLVSVIVTRLYRDLWLFANKNYWILYKSSNCSATLRMKKRGFEKKNQSLDLLIAVRILKNV